MDIDDIPANVAKGRILPVYLLGGEERWLVARASEAIRTVVVGRGPPGLAEDVFDGKQTQGRTVIQACRTLPMMAKRRLVFVRGVDQMPSDEQEALIPYFAAPEPTTVLLLVAVAYDGRRRIALEAKKFGFLFPANHPDEDALGPWIEREAKARNTTLEPGVLESLSLAVGPDLAALSDALDRLVLYANGAPISVHDVDVVVTPVREVPAWDLADAIGHRNLADSLEIVSRLAAQRQHALPTLGLVTWQIHQIARAKAHLESKGEASMARDLRMRPLSVPKMVAQTKRWSVPMLFRAFRILAATDAALKGSKRDDARILEECVMALCGGAGMGLPGLRAPSVG